MTRKDFIALAKMIREFNQYHDEGSNTANHFDTQQIKTIADFCATQNPQFDHARFLQACGVE